ncbi:MAG: membrane protein insertase YidC [Sphingomonadales bacterium]|nr:membrane protein insertase YidC [Sphingomonadales bacterium]MDE2168657.1 membrane protein insertase YidC [Sphingomonadales bacterium]
MMLAMLLVGVFLFIWDMGIRHFYPNADKPKPVASATPTPAATVKPTREGGLETVGDRLVEAQDLKTQLTRPRVAIVAPGLVGSINLAGGVVDDLSLPGYKETIDKNSPDVRLYSPAGTPAQHFAQVGWVNAPAGIALPDGNTVWTAPAGAKLTPTTPVTLSWANTTGQTFTLTYAIDKDYMITVTQKLANAGSAPLKVQPFALINRTSKTASQDAWNLHSGPIANLDESVNFGPSYDCAHSFFLVHCTNLQKAGQIDNEGTPQWLGFTDIYWMSVLAPANPQGATSDFRSLGNDLYRADVVYPAQTIAPGSAQSTTTRIIAGAKDNAILDKYEAQGINKFSYSIDWGWFWFFEKPIFALLRTLFHLVGNFGVAIMLLTAIVRGIMFPVAQRGFASMAAMRAIQPKVKALQERYKDDRAKLQEETMKLYKEEKVNPLAGCLPMFLQIPVFFALYKVLMVSIGMRHQPFVLWIRDLSAPDPLHILNLFGLLPFTPPSFLGIGILALILGFTMWLQFKLQPAATDPAQQQMMSIMPWMMMFIMAPFASGLLIYWITSNLLTVAQQKYLYSKHPGMRAAVEKEREVVARAAKSKK